MSRMTYSIGYSWARILRPLAESGREQAAIARLEDFRGDADDVRTCAAMHYRVGEGGNAEALLRLLDTPPGDG